MNRDTYGQLRVLRVLQPDLKYLQGRGIHYFSGQPVPSALLPFTTLTVKKYFFHISNLQLENLQLIQTENRSEGILLTRLQDLKLVD